MAELVAYIENSDIGLSSSSMKYDLLVAADVFVYIGDLSPVMASATKRCCNK